MCIVAPVCAHVGARVNTHMTVHAFTIHGQCACVRDYARVFMCVKSGPQHKVSYLPTLTCPMIA